MSQHRLLLNLVLHRRQALAVARAEEALADPDHGEVGSAWYHASPPAEQGKEAFPNGAWWYINGAVERKPDLLWRNGRYVWEPEAPDPERWTRGRGGVHCPICKDAGAPPPAPPRRHAAAPPRRRAAAPRDVGAEPRARGGGARQSARWRRRTARACAR
jgi:hypothetical protein